MESGKRTAVSAACVVVAALAGATMARAQKSIDGLWMDSHGEVILEVAPCGPRRCAKVAWLKQPFGPDGQALRDYRNSEPKLRSRFVCGMTIARGFRKQPDGIWGDGEVYVPDLGQSFSGYAEVLSVKAVRITGYVFLSVFGQSEVWTRVTKPFRHCSADLPASARAPAAPPPKPKLLREGRARE